MLEVSQWVYAFLEFLFFQLPIRPVLYWGMDGITQNILHITKTLFLMKKHHTSGNQYVMKKPEKIMTCFLVSHHWWMRSQLQLCYRWFQNIEPQPRRSETWSDLPPYEQANEPQLSTANHYPTKPLPLEAIPQDRWQSLLLNTSDTVHGLPLIVCSSNAFPPWDIASIAPCTQPVWWPGGVPIDRGRVFCPGPLRSFACVCLVITL